MGDERKIPGRQTILLSSWLFIVASFLLLTEFVLIYLNAGQKLYYDGSPPLVSWATPHIVSIFGVLEAIGWAIGFLLLIEWLVWYAFDAWGKDRVALWAAMLKLLASAFFCIQPASQLGDPNSTMLVPGLGVPWSNFVGICLFHSGNLMDSMRMPLERTALLSWGNMPTLGMYVYVSATWLLVVADALASGASVVRSRSVPGRCH